MPAISSRRPSADFQPELLRVDDLSAGIDLRRSPSLLKPNRARRLRNFSLQEPGALLVYPGWRTHSTASLGAGRCQGGQRVYLSGSTFTLAAFGGSVYKPSDAGVWNAAVLAGLHASNEIYFPYDRDLVAVFDGSSVPKKSTDGTTWTQMGITAPTVAPTASAVAGGSLTNGNTYELSYTYTSSALGTESNASATVQQAVAAGNLTVRGSVTASADPQVDGINVYLRDVTGGETVRRKYASYANATTTHDVTSNTWSSAVEEPNDHDVPPALAFGVLWKNRWWARHATVKNRLHFTQIFESQSWPTLYYIDIPFERGDDISAIIAFGDTLVVFGQASKPFLIIGQTSLDFEVRPSVVAEAGAFGPRAVELIENGIVHAVAEGVYIFDGASDRLLSDDIDPGWRDLVNNSAVVADLHRMAVTYHRARKEIRVAVPRLFPYGTAGEWILDLHRTRLQDTAAWTSTDRTIGGYIHWDGNEATAGDRGRLLSWSDTVGKLYEEAYGTSADGGTLASDYEGPTFVTGLNTTQFTAIYGEVQPSTGTFGLEIRVDGSSVSTPSIDLGSGLPYYGVASYGVEFYGGKERKAFVKDLPLAAEGRSITVKATYVGTDSFRWFNYAFSHIREALPRGL
jgi:hypothetical protein